MIKILFGAKIGMLLMVCQVLFFPAAQYARNEQFVAADILEVQAEEERTPGSQAPIDHEIWLARIDRALASMDDCRGKFLIAVAHLGEGEKGNTLSKDRLRYVEEIVQSRGVKISFVAAEGNRVSGLGRVELYACSDLVSVLPYGRNAAVAIQHKP